MIGSLRRTVSLSGVKSGARRFTASLEGYGQHLFQGAVAAPYLKKAGLAENTLASPAWTTNGNADKVASAVLEWAKVSHKQMN